MKNIFYFLFTAIFKLFRLFPINNNKVVMIHPHKGGSHDSLGEMSEYILKQGNYIIKHVYSPTLNSVSSAFKQLGFFIFGSYNIATAKYIFLNDNFMPMSSMKFSSKTTIVQLWHAEGAFKKFGLMTNLNNDIKKRMQKLSNNITYVCCTSENIRDIYAEAFGVDKDRVIAVGSPRLDYLLRPRNTDDIKNKIEDLYPESKDKKLILYAPTFRDNPENDEKILDNFDFDMFKKELGDEYFLLVKLHPQIHTSKPLNNVADVTKSFDIADLTLICDCVITDYSSVCMDFYLLNKRCYFYAFDLESYNKERSFYNDYDSYVPGPVSKDFKSLIEDIKKSKEINYDSFGEYNFDNIDTNNCERVFNTVFKNQYIL